MAKLIFVLLDGCNGATAQACMGYMAALTAEGQARFVLQSCELPAISRPLYACIFTGLRPAQSGIVHNTCWRPNAAPSLFGKAHDAGLVTAAAAYYWMSELFNTAPYVPARDRLTLNPALPLSYGIFYNNDAYPDDHVFQDAEALRQHYAPDLLLVHSMGIDYTGHIHGGASAEYRNAARRADMLLAQYVPLWRDAGYTIVITSDHGMSADKYHNSSTPEERQVPAWLVSENPNQNPPAKQVQWFPWCCELLQIDKIKHHKNSILEI